MTLTFFNVGYGEAVLAECPDPARPRGSFIMLLDGGSGEAKEFPSELPQRAPLIRELERRGLDHIDVVVSTHIHEDHVCGLLPVLERFTPGELWQALDGALALQLPQLPQVELDARPKRMLGANTADCLHSGMVHGTAAMVDGMVENFRAALHAPEAPVVATGTLPRSVRTACRTDIDYRETLILDGLYTIWQRNARR